jgi:hypothetical protein
VSRTGARVWFAAHGWVSAIAFFSFPRTKLQNLSYFL